MEEKKINKSIAFSIVAAFILAVIVVGATFAYFRAAGETDVQEITTTNLKMNFVAGEWVRADEKMMPISDAEIATKAVELPFTITNTGDEHMNVTIKLTDITMSEQLKDVDFRWGLFNAETGNALSRGVFADIGDATEVMLYTNTIIDAAEPDITNSYVLRIWIHDDRSAQDSFMGRSFSARVKVTGESVTYTPESCFTFDSSTGTITAYDATTCGLNVVVPKTVGGVTVSSLGTFFWEDYESLARHNFKSIILPNTITTFDYILGAFETLTIPEGVTNVSSIEASNLVNLFLPDTITSMNFPIYGYSSNLVIPSKITTLKGGNMNPSDHNYILQEGITTIENLPLKNEITNIEIPESVTSIKNYAFTVDLQRRDALTVVLLGKTEIPEGFEEDWNCIKRTWQGNNLVCSEYATVTFRP